MFLNLNKFSKQKNLELYIKLSFVLQLFIIVLFIKYNLNFSNTITYHNVKLCVYVFFTLSDFVFIILDSTTSC